jgi:hypothetical protein
LHRLYRVLRFVAAYELRRRRFKLKRGIDNAIQSSTLIEQHLANIGHGRVTGYIRNLDGFRIHQIISR